MQEIFRKTMHEPYEVLVDGVVVKQAPIFAVGFDTLRLGLYSYNSYKEDTLELLNLCSAVGATLHSVKYPDPLAPRMQRTSSDNKIISLYKKNYPFKGSMGKYFFKARGVWVIEYKGAMHWLINWQGQYCTTIDFELYGLSQLDHDLGLVRFELLNKILAHYNTGSNSYKKPIIKGYDFSVDINRSFNYMLLRFIAPYIQLRPKSRLGLYRYRNKPDSVYLKKYSSRLTRNIIMYDKKLKNGLVDTVSLTRVEFTEELEKKARIELDSYSSLQAICYKELLDIDLISEEMYYELYW